MSETSPENGLCVSSVKPLCALCAPAKLLASALAAGVQVSIQGDELKVKGPSGAKSLAQLLIERKADVVSAFGEYSPQAAGALMCATDAEFENLGASGNFPIVQQAAEGVARANLNGDMSAIIAGCFQVLKLARAQLATKNAA